MLSLSRRDLTGARKCYQLIYGRVVPLGKLTSNHGIIHIKGVDFMTCDIYLNKAVQKRKKKRKESIQDSWGWKVGQS